MGTLGNQRPRNVNTITLSEASAEIVSCLKELNYKTKALDAIEILKLALQLREQDIMLVDGDYHDEHVGGLAELVKNNT